MAEVESFTLDHNKVIAPYVRLISNEYGKKGDVISNFDIRFLQPNKQEMPTGVIHTFEQIYFVIVSMGLSISHHLVVVRDST